MFCQIQNPQASILITNNWVNQFQILQIMRADRKKILHLVMLLKDYQSNKFHNLKLKMLTLKR